MKKEILRTLAYGDIFDYPLLPREIWWSLIGSKKTSYRAVVKQLSWLVEAKFLGKEGDFYFLLKRRKTVNIRRRREYWSQKKLKIARRLAEWLRLIPTIKMVAITGALAMRNSDKSDDIDLLIVTAKNRLWLTRLFTTTLTELVACRRRPKDVDVRDKICLNMFLDKENLAVPPNERNLFTAHEVCQLKPLWEKDGVYNKFIKKNKWVKKFLPNWKPWPAGSS